MAKFILGYLPQNDMVELTEFKTQEEAEFESEEWCFVEANSLDEAKGLYEETFERLKEEGKISGCF
jgi:hypothetical protein